jgi:hypothetical protein
MSLSPVAILHNVAGTEVGTAGAPLRVDPTGTTTQPVSGTVGITGSVAVTGTFWQATQAVSLSSLPALATGSNTIGKIDQGVGGASAWKVDGSAVTQPVSGTFWQATQPVSIAATVAVSGPLTDTQLRAAAVPVSVSSLPLPSGAATEATLASIKDTAGIKKITDALPAGDNSIGRVKLTDGTTVAIVDATHGSLVGIDIAHYKVHQGLHYFIQDWVEVSGAGSVLNLLIKVPAGKYVHFLYKLHTGDAFTYRLYEATTVSADGTAVSAFNSNRNSANTTGITVFTGPTITADGNQIVAGQLSSGGKTGGMESRENEMILKANQNYLLRVTKTTSGVAFVEYGLEWYENA